MSKKPVETQVDEMLPEYDFSKGVRGKYYEEAKAASNLVFIEPDVAEFFPDAESVNQALRVLAEAARRSRMARSRRRSE
jgi:hypothetical protein